MKLEDFWPFIPVTFVAACFCVLGLCIGRIEPIVATGTLYLVFIVLFFAFHIALWAEDRARRRRYRRYRD